MEPTLRPATIEDLPLLVREERRYMHDVEPEHEAGWLDALDRNLAVWIAHLPRTVVAEVEGEAAGYAMWMPSDDAATLITISVVPAHRRGGLARRLLARYAADAATAGFGLLRLGVHHRNPARSLYTSAGFEQVGTDGDYLLHQRILPVPGPAVT